MHVRAQKVVCYWRYTGRVQGRTRLDTCHKIPETIRFRTCAPGGFRDVNVPLNAAMYRHPLQLYGWTSYTLCFKHKTIVPGCSTELLEQLHFD